MSSAADRGGFSTRTLGRTGVELTELGFGGAHLGELFETLGEDTAQATLAAAWAAGVRYFDTAPWYGHGLSEHRTGHFLRQRPRGEFVVSTKVGRVYRAPRDPATYATAPWLGGLPFELRFDYTRDGVLRSFEDSLQRLSLNRVDLLVIHDLDAGYHGDETGVAARFEELDAGGGFAALEELRAQGVIAGIGAGINVTGMIRRFLERFDIDFFLVAMPYTLLDQDALETELPACAGRDVGVVIGAPFASGILVTGEGGNARYGYESAPPRVRERVKRLASLCAQHGVALPAAALRFPLGHPSVASVIPGAVSPGQVAQNVAAFRSAIAPRFWTALRDAGLIRPDAPTP